MAETTYVAFRSSEALHQSTDGFIQRMAQGAARPEPEAIEKIMKLFIEEALHAFLIAPTEQAKLSSGLRRIITLTADTVSKATHMVVKSTVKKLDIQQNRKTAEYMDSVRIQLDVGGEPTWFVAFPIPDSMAEKGRRSLQQVLDGEEDRARAEVIEYFHELTDLAMQWYFERPIKLLGFGPIMRKVADMGVATTRKAMHTAVDKVVPKLHGEEFSISARYALSLMADGPAPKA